MKTEALLSKVHNLSHRFQQKMFEPIDVSVLAVFRILFGALMLWEIYRYFEFDRIERYYIEPSYFFAYEFFPFIQPWPGNLMYLHYYVMGLFAMGIMLGLFYRLSAIGFFLTYSYTFLLDKAQHNNHYYLICLLAFLLIFADAHRWLSLDQRYLNLKSQVVPYWQLFMLRMQMVIVYFYAGVAKINPDWLQGEPVGSWIYNRAHYPLQAVATYFDGDPLAAQVAFAISDFFISDYAPYFFAYSGMLFDLFIGFMLLYPPTRLIALPPMFFFHLMNKWLFNIGIFPYLALASTLLFAPPDWPRRLLRRPTLDIPASFALSSPKRRLILSFVLIYLTIQILVPLRHHLYPSNVAWTEEGHRFSWRMKLRSKSADIEFLVTDPATNTNWIVNMRSELTRRQIGKMATRPDMIHQYAQHLAQKWQAQGVANPIVHVNSQASLNYRPWQPFIKPNVNLVAEPYGLFDSANWIYPLQGEPQPRVVSQQSEADEE